MSASGSSTMIFEDFTLVANGNTQPIPVHVGYTLRGLLSDTAWDAATLYVMVSADDGATFEFMRVQGVIVVLEPNQPNTFAMFSESERSGIEGWDVLALRSSVPQSVDRVFKLAYSLNV